MEVELALQDVGELPDAVEHTAYRIVQESLTNVARHSGAARASVSMARENGSLRIEVADDGRGSPGAAAGPGGAPPSGNGVRGMRERAQALGGTLDAGPGESVSVQSGPIGWTVRARLPVGSDGGRP